MFQQRGKFYSNTSTWKHQHINSNNNKNTYQDIYNPTQKTSKFPCSLRRLNRLNIRGKNSKKTGVRKANCLYSVGERFTSEAGSNTGIDIYKLKQKMANTLSVMTNVLRNVVSKQRIRYKEKGFNLDLAYVCDNIIAMGYPADNYESMYRNPLGDVYKFLEDNHHDHYKIYNLCLERSYDITKFHGRVSVYPFEDHNPPTIELILKFCEDVDNWLKANPINVAAVHCKAGKGRTGTMICCYLLYSGQQRTAEDALACYDEKRTKDRKGVTIPSQRRYVQYFSKLMRTGLTYERRTLQFCEIRFSKANTLHSQGTVHCSIYVLQEKVQQLQNFSIDFRKNSVLDMNNPSIPISGDIKVELTKNTKKIFHFWFNTFFVTDSSVIEGEGNDVKFVYTLQKLEIDDVHKDKCYPDDFKVELVFNTDDNNVDREHIKVSTSNRPTLNHRSLLKNAGTDRISSHHQQQSNNCSLPQNSSSCSEMNFICDQKSSSSTSVSSSVGVSGTDTSNGYESNRRTTQRNSGVVQSLNNHHNNHYMAARDVNDSVVFSEPPPTQHISLPPSYMEQQQQHKEKQPLNTIVTLPSMANQRIFQRQDTAGAGDIVGGGGEDVNAYHSNDVAATFQPSTNLNANKTRSICSSSNNSTNIISNSYNHNNSNSSSKTSSVSSQTSSSAIGDNEEDWESANTTTIQNKTQENEVEGTKLNTFNNISSVDVIKQNNVIESGCYTTILAEEEALAKTTTSNEIKCNQQHKQMKQHHPQQQEQQPIQQKLCNGLIDNELATTPTSKTKNNINNKNFTINTNTTTNTNTNKTTSQQLSYNCLQTGDLSSELKCC